MDREAFAGSLVLLVALGGALLWNHVAESRQPLPLSEESVTAVRLPVTVGRRGRTTLDSFNPGRLESVIAPVVANAFEEDSAPRRLQLDGQATELPTPLPPCHLQSPGPRLSTASTSSELRSQERVALPWAKDARQSAAILTAVHRSEERVRSGLSLIGRGASYSARAEFIAALESIAQAHDCEESTQLYTGALRAGLTAIEEAAEIHRLGSRAAAIDMKSVIARHRTRVLKQVDLARVTPFEAAERYRGFAEEQLAGAAAGETCGSMAIFGLGKLALSQAGPRPRSYDKSATALTYFRAALLAHPGNFLAANESAVLLSDAGELVRAREVLIQSVTRTPHAATWKNLSSVHERLGETALAQSALAQVTNGHAHQSQPTPSVEWLDPAAFSQATKSSGGPGHVSPEAWPARR